MLELRLSTLATPSRVADATQMLADAIGQGFPNAEDEVSLVVENRNMRVRVGAWSPEAVTAMENFRGFIENPTQHVAAFDAAGMADAMERYCREALPYEPTFWKPGAKRAFRKVDREFIEHLSIVSAERLSFPDAGVETSKTVRGTTTIISPVLRLGRSKERSEPKARIRPPNSKEIELPIDVNVYPRFCDALKHGRPMRITLLATWMSTDSGLILARHGTRAIDIAEYELTSEHINAALASIGPLMTIEEADELYRGLRREDDDE